jgi:hypothetical protein
MNITERIADSYSNIKTDLVSSDLDKEYMTKASGKICVNLNTYNNTLIN